MNVRGASHQSRKRLRLPLNWNNLVPVRTAALFLVAAVDAALYLCPPPQAPVAPVKTAAVVPRQAAARTYFHSSLSAPAMSTSEHTGLGYFSTDASAEYRGEHATAVSTTPRGGNRCQPRWSKLG